MRFKNFRSAFSGGGILWVLLAVFPAVSPSQETGTVNKSEAPKAGAASIADYASGADPQTASENRDYIWLDVKDKDLQEILSSISKRVDVNIIADPGVKEKVTIQLDRVEWRKALEVIARQTNCKIIEDGERLIRFTQPPAINMEFQDADIKIVLELLAKQAGTNIVMNSDVSGKVSLSLREVPWREALDTIVKTAGYVVVKEETSTGNEIIRVVRPDSLREQLETRSFSLKYVRPSDPYRAIISDVDKWATKPTGQDSSSGALDQGSAAGGAGSTAKEEAAFTLETALRETKSKEGEVKYDPHTNTFIVKDIKPKLDEIANIIKLVDVQPSQVFCEVKFIRTTNQDLLERGIKFDLPSTPERDGFQIIARAADPNPIATDPLFLFGGTFPFDLGAIHNIPENFAALGILDFTQTRLVLSMIKDDENSRIVQEPTLTMLDNKPATIFVGETVPFAVQKIQSDQNGNITVAIDENKRSPINIGFTLFLTPHVIPSTDMVDLTVIPKVSALSGTTSEIEGFERFSFTDEDSDNQSFIDLPRESAQTVVTYLRVHDGHTAVIGGLQTERKVEIESKVPVLSSIPILGNLFTWKRKKNNVDSLIIMITPHIIKNVGDEDSILERQRTRHQEKDFFYQRYEKGGEASPPKKPAEPTTEAPAAPPAPSAAPPTASPEPATK
ncbi:MAG TPA: secretin N-terminal domain-containing protein [Planctomycetota bacterium]|nr:secretin N-terminal domain-containing protein [Planctomycetota bacterium]